jgi:putative spermidine/putrescine transport system substrate-binding protein
VALGQRSLSVVTGLTRRDLLERGAAGALALSRVPAARASSGPYDGTIRIAGLGYDLPTIALQSQAGKELGLRILYEFAGPYATNRLVREEPAAFDILLGYNHLVNPQWPSGNLQPVEIAKISQWDKISPLFKLGKVRPSDRSAATNRPWD